MGQMRMLTLLYLATSSSFTALAKNNTQQKVLSTLGVNVSVSQTGGRKQRVA
jgi:hypothetical protein